MGGMKPESQLRVLANRLFLSMEQIIKPEHILDMIKKLEDEGYAPTSIKQSLSVVHQMFERAAASKMIPSDPTAEVKLSIEAPGKVERIKNIVNKQEALEAEKEGREAEMLDVTPHSFRHTFVTRCVQSGMKQ